ncbi:hypothetical protein GEMRC1_003695 [Eukaryota sp. GEM-RC1]
MLPLTHGRIFGLKPSFHPIIAELLQLVTSIISSTYGYLFTDLLDADYPVPEDYFSHVESPMDLHSIQKRLSNGYYLDPKHCIQDLKLVYSNPMSYYHKSLDIYSISKSEGKYWIPKAQNIISPFKSSKADKPSKTRVAPTRRSRYRQTKLSFTKKASVSGSEDEFVPDNDDVVDDVIDAVSPVLSVDEEGFSDEMEVVEVESSSRKTKAKTKPKKSKYQKKVPLVLQNPQISIDLSNLTLRKLSKNNHLAVVSDLYSLEFFNSSNNTDNLKEEQCFDTCTWVYQLARLIFDRFVLNFSQEAVRNLTVDELKSIIFEEFSNFPGFVISNDGFVFIVNLLQKTFSLNFQQFASDFYPDVLSFCSFSGSNSSVDHDEFNPFQ